MTKQVYKNWYYTEEDWIVWLYFDKAGSGTNSLSSDVLEELDLILHEINGTRPRGLVILSAKQNGFIAGADIKEFTEIKDRNEARILIQSGQAVFDHLEKLPFPTVSLIHGFCLGGGLELALACRYRIAKDDLKTRLGLPEVKVGIHPGFGGTVRLPKLIGVPQAMDMMLTGRTLNVYKAKKIGLVDHVVPDRHLRDMACKYIADSTPVHRAPFYLKMLNHRFARPVMKKVLLDRTRKKIKERHYPAPFALIELWSQFGDRPGTMLNEEARSVASLMTGETARNLIRSFFLRDTLKSLAKGPGFSGSHVHVIGAGVMGGDIAAWCALHGFKVTLQDRIVKSIAAAMKRAYVLFNRRLHNPRLVRNTMDMLMPDIKGTGLRKADIIIEAIVEDKEAKQNLYQEIEPQIKPDALLTTNTSSIPLEELAPALSRPERLVGLHFFNPVAKMPLVEIIAGEETDPDEIRRAMAFTKLIDHLPLKVKSAPGFLVNRILMPYLLEAVMMVEEGVSPSVIDRAAEDFGMPMGPVILADAVGLDICLHAGEVLAEKLGTSVPVILGKKVNSGNTGKKSGQGFYTYKNGKQVVTKEGRSTGVTGEIKERLILQMVNEAVSCLDEGIVEDADLLDAGMIYGTGFAPFRGGVIQYCRTEGIKNVLNRLKSLEDRFGDRFHPSRGWDRLVSEDTSD